MKQILFRGKTDEGVWVYGSLILAGNYCCILPADKKDRGAIYLDADCGTIDGFAVPVIPETVGRLIEHPCYDGTCTDQQFFEGDIICVWRNRRADTENDKPDDIAIVIDEYSITANGRGYWFPQDTTAVKVIGNIYDNPELLPKKEIDLYKHYRCFEKGEKI